MNEPTRHRAYSPMIRYVLIGAICFGLISVAINQGRLLERIDDFFLLPAYNRYPSGHPLHDIPPKRMPTKLGKYWFMLRGAH